MVRIISLFLLVTTIHMLSLGQSVSVEKIRSMYFTGWIGDCGATELSDLLSKEKVDNNPLLMAYKGAAISTTANCKKMPFSKLSTFTQGREMIENSVNLAPDNVEIRFLRFSIQANIPGFLNYNNISEDKQFILSIVNSNKRKDIDADLMGWMLKMLMESGHLEKEEKRIVQSLMASL